MHELGVTRAVLQIILDAVAGYAELGAAVCSPAPADVLDDLCLGLSAVALGLVIWLAVVLVGDPDGRVRASLSREGRSGGATE